MDPYNTADAYKIERPQPVVAPAAAAPRAGNPYAAPGARIAEAASGPNEKAGRGQRLAAVILDTIMVAAPAVLVAVVLPVMQHGGSLAAGGSLSTGGGVLLALVLLWFVGFAIYQLVLLHRQGQTLGKKLMGVRIVRTDGSRAGLGRIFLLRYFAPGLIGAIPFIGGFFSLADALLIFGAEKRCIHDYFADTIVVTA
ncbi:MAG: RDD family protein [Lysobacteraceae bacterium]